MCIEPGQYQTFGFFYFMEFAKLKGTENYYVSKKGYVIIIEKGKERVLVPFEHHKSKNLYVKIKGKKMSLLTIMIQTYIPEILCQDRISYKITNNKIPLNSIKVKRFSKDWLDEDREQIMINFKCRQKAASANMRSTQKITSLEIFTTLNIHNFQCVYCSSPLKEDDWHLDHYYPISKGGGNVFENLVPSCSICNKMKGALLGGQFYRHITKVYNNFLFKNENNKATTA